MQKQRDHSQLKDQENSYEGKNNETDLFNPIDTEFKKEVIKILKELRGAINRNGLPRWLSGKKKKNLPASVGATGSIPGLGRPPGERNDNPLKYSCLRNPMDKDTWRAIVHGVTKELDTDLATKQL